MQVWNDHKEKVWGEGKSQTRKVRCSRMHSIRNYSHTSLLSLFVTRHCSSWAQMLSQNFETHTDQKPTETAAFPPYFKGESLELWSMGAAIPNTKLKYRNHRCNDKYPKKDRVFFLICWHSNKKEGEAKELFSGSVLFLLNAGLVWCKGKGRKTHHKDPSNTVFNTSCKIKQTLPVLCSCLLLNPGEFIPSCYSKMCQDSLIT